MGTRRALLFVTLASSSLGTARAQTRPATAPSPTLAALQASERDELLKSLPATALPLAPLADVADVGRDGDHLRVRTALAPTPGPCRIAVAGLPGYFTVMNTALHARGGPPLAAGVHVPDGFLFEWYRFDLPGITDQATTVQVLPVNVQLVRVTETPDGGGSQVQLTEQRRTPSPDAVADGSAEPAVRLKVTYSAGRGDAPVPAQVECTAASFAALCRERPAEVARYLEPLLRDLHADAAALPVDLPLAYQVFAADVVVDPAVAEQVRTLVAGLDADEPHDRDTAGRQLDAMGPVAAAAVARIDPATLSPEQRARTAVLLRRARPLDAAAVARLAGDVDYLLDCLNADDPFVVGAALDRLRTVTGQDVPFDRSLTGPARRDAVWSLRQRLDRR